MSTKEVKETHPLFISIDPGINYCSIIVINPKDKFEVAESHLVNNNRAFKPDEKELELLHGTRTVKIMNITNLLSTLIDKYSISNLIVEAPFYSHLSPMAYGSLLEVIFGIKYLVVMPRLMKMSLIEPTAVKRLFTSKGNAPKSLMKEFLLAKIESGEIIVKCKEVALLSEHEIDGIAVGFTHWYNKQNPPTIG